MEGKALTSEERAFYEECKALQSKQIAKAGLKTTLQGATNQEQPVDPGSWYENENTLAALNDLLTKEQQSELAAMAQEKVTHDREAAAYKRTNKLTEKLGLNEADRLALYEYLYRNPDASNAGIAEQLSPELRDLMPKDNPPNTATHHSAS